jgi:hypothetical protein
MNEFQNGLVLADKIHLFYNIGPGHSEGINTALVEHLGVALYKQFCEKMKLAPIKKDVTEPQYFSEAFLKNTVSIEDIVSDQKIREQWHISILITTLKEL